MGSSWLTPPTFNSIDDPITRQKQLVLYWMLLALNIMNVLIIITTLPFSPDPVVAFMASGFAQVLLTGGLMLMRKGHGNIVGVVISAMLTLMFFVIAVTTPTPISYLHLFVVPLIFATFVSNSVYVWSLCIAQTVGIILLYFNIDESRLHMMPIDYYWTTISVLFVFVVSSYLNTHIQRTYLTKLVELNSALEDANQQEVALREQAVQASQAKSQFLASMSHELRTPLNAILGYSEMVQEDLEETPGVSTESIDDMTKIHQAGKHLLTLISNILDMSKIEAGHMEVDQSKFDLSALLNEIHALTAPLASQKHNRLDVNLPASTIEMNTDRTKLKQILLNLISNASKFTQDGQITLTAQRKGERIVLDVKDTGIGIEPEALEKIFDAFTQADNSTTRNYGGTGLGLTLCEHFAVMLNGSISAKSTPGQGSTFTVDIPINYIGEDNASTV